MPKSKTDHLTARPGCASTPALTKPAVTRWFPGDVKPVRAGLYGVKWRSKGCSEYIEWCWWDGSGWAWAYASPSAARRFKSKVGASQNKTWRGLSANPARSGNK